MGNTTKRPELTLSPTYTPSQPVNTETFSNAIDRKAGLAADPFIVYDNGFYYYMVTMGDKIVIRRSNKIQNITSDESFTAYTVGNEVKSDIWAPELHKIGDKWYIYASGATIKGDFGSIHMFCLESDTSDPFSRYTFKDFVAPDTFAIDETVFTDDKDGKLYTAYSEFTADGQVIKFAAMVNPWTIDPDKCITVSKPEYDWEKKGSPDRTPGLVNEGPAFLQRNGRIFLFYSASGCWSEYYCLGMLTLDTRDDYFDVSSWDKSSDPVFSTANKVYGVGHCTFFRSPDLSEDWIVYHGKDNPSNGESNRYGYVQKFTWDSNGYPVLGSPLGKNVQITVPSGQIE
ncbi:MAG: glycoside hydrolase family 43 protein [Clostridiales bacterium]|nr:glycoside hydrolase family 43 protein [Clostridiales bacterium]